MENQQKDRILELVKASIPNGAKPSDFFPSHPIDQWVDQGTYNKAFIAATKGLPFALVTNANGQTIMSALLMLNLILRELLDDELVFQCNMDGTIADICWRNDVETEVELTVTEKDLLEAMAENKKRG